MLFAYLTTVLFAFSAVLARRSQAAVGTERANVGRLGIGLAVLGLWVGVAGRLPGGAALGWFVLSGVVGMGLGDVAFFGALPRLGSRLTIMLMQCLSVPVAIAVEWAWLGTRLTAGQVGAAAVVLAGIAVALMPTRRDPPRVRVRWSGVGLGVLAAVGQGVGAVLSRKGFELATAGGQPIDGLSAAFPRVVGGLAVTLVWYAAWRAARAGSGPRGAAAAEASASPGRGWWWVLAHGLAGPVLGMGTFQLALAHAPSGLVLPITATTPLVVIPFAYWLEGERATRRSLVGGAIAVAGAVGLAVG